MYIITSDNKIIISQEEQPYVGKYTNIPGGYIEDGETPEQTAKKELLEEFGIKSHNLELFEKEELGNTVITTKYTFIAKSIEQISNQHLESGEKIKPMKVTFEEFLEEIQKPQFRDKYTHLNIINKTPKELEQFKQKLFSENQKQKIEQK